MVLMGVGVLLPWNVILNTLDFLDNKFPNADIPRNSTSAYVWVQLPLLALMVKVRGIVSSLRCIVARRPGLECM